MRVRSLLAPAASLRVLPLLAVLVVFVVIAVTAGLMNPPGGRPAVAITPTPSPTPLFPTTVVTLTNNTGQTASALSLTFSPPSASLYPVSQNAPGCGAPAYNYGGALLVVLYSMTVLWPTACVDPGESVTLRLMTDCPAPSCQAPAVTSHTFYAAKTFCIAGTSDAVPWEWKMTYGPGPTIIGPAPLGPLPFGQGGAAFAVAFATGMNSPPGVRALPLVPPQSHCFSLGVPPAPSFELFVRTPVGGPGPFCQVTSSPSGCSFNPTISELVPVGGTVGLVADDSANTQASGSSDDGANVPAFGAAAAIILACAGLYLRRRAARS